MLDSGVMLIAGVLVLASVLASQVSDRYGIPALVVFLVVGMLAGSEGPGALVFNDANFANFCGTIALAFILFSGGLDTHWTIISPVLWRGIFLATGGVVITAVLVGIFSWLALGMTLLTGLLLGSIVSSTDAAAVFAIMRRSGVTLKGNLKPLLEFESGSNDPMAVLLTMTFTTILTASNLHWGGLAATFVVNIFGGVLLGIGAGWLARLLFNKLHLGYEGLYPVLSIGIVLITFGLSDFLHSNGFVALYVCGILLNSSDFRYRLAVIKFHDGLAWLMQIMLFIVLGLLVNPSELLHVAGKALLVATFLMLVARPVAVFLGLWKSEFTLPEQLLTAWTGLRGAVPIVLATFPLAAGFEGSSMIFNIVFFIVLTSVLIQGIMLMPVARFLKVDDPMQARPQYSLEIQRSGQIQGETREIEVLPNMAAVGKTIGELDIPSEVLILLIGRGDDFIVPKGQTVIEPYDILLLLGESGALKNAGEAILLPRSRSFPSVDLDDSLVMLPSNTARQFLSKQVVVVGYGRVGSRICACLKEKGIPFVVAEQDREIVERLRKDGIVAVSGDAASEMTIAQAHVSKASVLVIATPDTMKVRRMAEIAKELNPSIEIIIRTGCEMEANLLKREGIGEVFLGEEELAKSMAASALQSLKAKA